MTSIAVLHERFPFIAGAEKVALEAARILDAPIYTTYVDPDVDLPADVDVITFNQEKYTSGPFSKLLTRNSPLFEQLRVFNLMLDISEFSGGIEEYDVILSSGPLSKHYIPNEEQKILHYPHTTPRYFYDLYRYGLQGYNYPFVKSGLKTYMKLWRVLDKEPNEYIDKFLANSEVVKNRIQKYYRRNADILYPPVTGDWRNEGDDGYFITWSRLDPKKRVRLIAQAFTHLDEKLIIVGKGPEQDHIEKIAHRNDNIDMRGYVSDIESLVASATAVIYAPQEEDFGLVGAEALAAGKPLIGVNEGFTKYQVTPTTGILFSPTVESLINAIQNFNPNDFNATEIQNEAEKYTLDSFQQQLLEVVKETSQL